MQRRWLDILVAGRYGVAGAGETFSRAYSLMVAPPTGLMVERSVARTCFAISYLFRESVHRGFDASVRDLDAALSRETSEPHYRLALLGRLAHSGCLPRARRFDPALLLGDTPWALEPRTVRLRTRFTPTVDTVVRAAALDLGVPRSVVVRHALSHGWPVVCNEIELLLAAGYRPAYLFRARLDRPRRARHPWSGPRTQSLYGLSWMRRPGVDLSFVDPHLTEPHPVDPLLAEL